MGIACGPSSKGIWNKRRSPAKLAEKARSNRHVTVRKKGLSKYQGDCILLTSGFLRGNLVANGKGGGMMELGEKMQEASGLSRPDPVDALLEEQGVSERDRALVEAFLALPEDMRETVARAVVRAAVGILGTVSDDGIPFRVYGREEWIRAMGFYQRALWFGCLAEDGPETAGEDDLGKAPGEGQ